MARIYSGKGEQTAIDQDKVLEFFQLRAKKSATLGYKQAVIYQDKNPELAQERDQAEKTLLLPKIQLTGKERLLDVGCGTGRWAEIINDRVTAYHGVDASIGLLEIAQEKFSQENSIFSCIKAEHLNFDTLNVSLPFHRILSFGVMIYLNEPELRKYLSTIPILLSEEGLFIVREPIALEKRLTLDLHYSEDMEQSYSAIYRTEDELLELMNEAFNRKLQLIESDFVFKEAELNHRSETKMKYFLFKGVV